jgi:hypothetical protein
MSFDAVPSYRFHKVVPAILSQMFEFMDTPEWELRRKLDSFMFSLELLQRNYDELCSAIAIFERAQNPGFLALGEKWKRKAMLKEVMFLLHNYLASAKSLLDHSRVLYRDLYLGTNIFPEYKDEISARFTCDALVQFVHGLRENGRIRQRPGEWNALGRLKFNMPNPYNVYLHDTPAKQLFTRSFRAFSHGCIRLERPMDLALYLLRDQPRWTQAAIERDIATGTERTIRLTSPQPVYVLYWTAWVGDDGHMEFHRDHYQRDAALAAALR